MYCEICEFSIDTEWKKNGGGGGGEGCVDQLNTDRIHILVKVWSDVSKFEMDIYIINKWIKE